VPAKQRSRGQLRGQIIGTCDDYGIDEGSVSIIVRTFMTLRQDTPIHWIDMCAGVLLFAQSLPNDPCSGVIYVYEKRARVFWGLDFDDGCDSEGNQFFTREEFEALAEEYNLNEYAANPSLLAPLAEFKTA